MSTVRYDGRDTTLADLAEALRPYDPCVRIGGCLKLFGADVGCLCDHNPRTCMCYEHVWYRLNPADYAAALSERASVPNGAAKVTLAPNVTG
jgi:hypothetical protein